MPTKDEIIESIKELDPEAQTEGLNKEPLEQLLEDLQKKKALDKQAAEDEKSIDDKAQELSDGAVVVAFGKGVSCSRKGTLKAGQPVKPNYFQPGMFNDLLKSGQLSTAEAYKAALKKAEAAPERKK
jgi:hypothetical protein